MSLLAIDIGSSRCKAVVFTSAGEVIARSVRAYSPKFPQPGFAEIDSAKFWTAVCETSREATRDLANDAVQALCLSSHGESFVPVDTSGDAIGPAILNIDNRASNEAQWCENRLGAQRIFEITGLIAHPMYPVPKILWLREHRPELYGQADRFLSVTDFIHTKLGLPPLIGYSLASRFLAFDVNKNEWSREILDAVGIEARQLPSPAPAGTIAGRLSREPATALGVSQGTPVVIGGHDQACGALGVGAVEAGRVSDSMGTYECLVAASDEPKLGYKSFAARLNSYSHVVPGKFLTLAYFPSGIMVQWFRNLLHKEGARENDPEGAAKERDEFAELEAGWAGAPSGLFVTPHLFGTGNPDFDPQARAMIYGLSAGSSRGQIYQGILEGIACELTQLAEILAEVCGEFSDLYVSGGGTRSAMGLKLRAAITGRRLHVMGCDDAVCQGAAILAGVAIGAYAGIEDAVKLVVREKEVIEPDANLGALYADQMRQYWQLYATLKKFRAAASGARPERDKK